MNYIPPAPKHFLGENAKNYELFLIFALQKYNKK